TGACVDQQARDQTERLRRLLTERDAMLTQLARSASSPAATPLQSPSGPPSGPPSAPSETPRPRRFTRFEVANPAVTVSQNDNGTYHGHTTYPKLAGSTVQVTAVAENGDEMTLYIRVP